MKTIVYFLLLLPLLALASCPSKSSNKGSGSAYPIIKSVTPDQGSLVGGTLVTIGGENFQSGTRVYFTQQVALNLIFENSTKLTCRTPPSEKAQKVTVVVENPNGESSGLPEAFRYLGNPPAIQKSTPWRGSYKGDEAVEIEGTDFQTGCRLFFDDTNVSLDSQTAILIRCKTPYHTPRMWAALKVINADGQISPVLEQGFYYRGEPPQITTLVPNRGFKGGGYEVKVQGNFFQNRYAQPLVTFANIPATIQSVAETEIVCTAPNYGNVTKVDVKVQLPYPDEQEFPFILPLLNTGIPGTIFRQWSSKTKFGCWVGMRTRMWLKTMSGPIPRGG
jgi:hypothetical protein